MVTTNRVLLDMAYSPGVCDSELCYRNQQERAGSQHIRSLLRTTPCCRLRQTAVACRRADLHNGHTDLAGSTGPSSVRLRERHFLLYELIEIHGVEF